MATFSSNANNSVTELQEICWNMGLNPPLFHRRTNGHVLAQLGTLGINGTGDNPKHNAAGQMVAHIKRERVRIGTAQLLENIGLLAATKPVCRNLIGRTFEFQARGILKDVKYDIYNGVNVMTIGYGNTTKDAKADAAGKLFRLLF